MNTASIGFGLVTMPLAEALVWLDGGNSFSVYGIPELSRWTGPEPRAGPEGIYISWHSAATRCPRWFSRSYGSRPRISSRGWS
jgi:hypothetical protein